MIRWTVTFRVAFAVVLSAFGYTHAADTQRPNILFIISDDLSAEALACYGNKQCRTPNIDALAARGTRFTRAYCQYPVCGPSRASLMSGRYAQAIGVTGNGASSKFTANLGNRPSMSQLFKDAGWYSARVSKIYHMRVPGDITAGVDGPDHAASWTERFNCQAPEWYTEGKHEHLTNEKLRFDRDKHYSLGFGGAFYVVRGQSDGHEQADVKAANKAIELIGKHKGKPFFLAVGLVRPHVPLVAPEPFFKPYPFKEMTLAPRVEGDWDDIPKSGISKNSKGSGLAGQPDKQRKVLSAYYASVAFMDAQVGRILKALDEHGLRDNTIVVFCSDHGYHLGEHDFWQKMSLHEESARVPFIIAPGKNVRPDGLDAYKGGVVSDSLVELIDMYPTLADLAGLTIPGHVQGQSLLAVLRDPSADVREAAYTLCRGGHLLRTERWAYLRHRDGQVELYDMQADPKQYRNLVRVKGHMKVATSLRAQLDAKLAGMRIEEHR